MKVKIFIAGIITSILLFIGFVAVADPGTEATALSLLRVGTSADFPPFSLLKDGKYTGFDIDVIEEVAKRIHYKIEITDMPFKTLLPAIQLGTIDVIAAGLTETPARAAQVFFAPAHWNSDPFVIVSKNSHLIKNGISDLADKVVVVNDGYTAAQYMEKNAKAKLTYLKSPSDALAALEAERAFAFVTAKSTLNAFLKLHPRAKEYRLFVLESTGESAGLAVTKTKPELCEKIKQAVSEMIKDGTIEALKQKWELS